MTSKLPAYATTVRHHNESSGNYTVIQLHDTDIVQFNDDAIILDTGGWDTATTKRRMNQASEVFNLGYHVYQKNKKWYVNYKDETIIFSGNLIILDRR